MPLVQNSNLPSYQRLRDEGRQILTSNRAVHQDIREMHIGFLNIMPDAALEATERQFFRLIGESNRVAQIHIHPFTLPNIERGPEAQNHIEKYYESFEQLKQDGLDALIITGANEETNPHVSEESFWAPLLDVLNWAQDHVPSTLCSCLASHAALTHLYGQPPVWRDDKRWGVFSHKVTDRGHPILRWMNTRFDAPHSRFSEITQDQFERAGMRILAQSEEAGVHMAASPDGFRLICFQGHPEYDLFSLLKEYRRDIGWYQDGTIDYEPPFPRGYFTAEAEALAKNHKDKILAGDKDAIFPEDEIAALLDNTWADSARAAIGNWIGLVYQTTHFDRRKLFMDGIDPNDPLKGL